MRFLFLMFLLCGIVSGCRIANLDEVPSEALGSSLWSEREFLAHDDAFKFKYWVRTTKVSEASSSTLVVVIEGDGASWSRAGNPPRNPTPRSPEGKRIAAQIPSGKDVLYLARPCQFLSFDEMGKCPSKYWTTERFSRSVLVAMNKVISITKSEFDKSDIALIGYSGGGVLAAELAILRDDASHLTTVASPLDLEMWTQFHDISPVYSATPSQAFLQKLSKLPIAKQFWFGEKDRIVPLKSQKRFMEAMPSHHITIIPKAGHNANWSSRFGDRWQMQ
ncbi:MAG: hypothetical protein N4A65_12615 [Cohaesibacter sp.]|nr:hypothetical protein [Cohaesibacter sp.]